MEESSTEVADAGIARVVEMVNGIVASDGGLVTLEHYDPDAGEVRVAYAQGSNEACPECVVTPETLRLFLLESFRVHGPQVGEVFVGSP